MPLLNQAYNYIKNEPYTKYLICLLIFELILNTIISYIIVVISNGKFNLIVYYMVLSYIQKMFNPIIIQPIIIKLTISIQSKFYKDYTLMVIPNALLACCLKVFQVYRQLFYTL